MKKIFLALLLLTAFLLRAQDPCGTNEVMDAAYLANPALKSYMNLLEKQTGTSGSSGRFTPPAQGSITIPVVVYVVHDGTSDVSDAQVGQQITALNNGFLPTGIKFCLATKANGANIPINSGEVQSTPGIIHIQNSTLTNHNSASTASQQALVATANSLITKDRYLRIWVVKNIAGGTGTILGYSMFPNASPIFDGIVMRYDVFGNGTSNLMANYNLGKTLVHEVGHWLNLYHTFDNGCGTVGGNCAEEGDMVCDTPPAGVKNFNCNPTANSCSEPAPIAYDDVTNYMDYTNDACKTHFTNGQIERMLIKLNAYRSELISNQNLIYTAVCGSSSLVAAQITPNNFMGCASATVPMTFSALTATTYSWNFGDPYATGGNPNTATTQNPSHIYTSAAGSPYTVTLTVTNASGQSASTSIQIYISNCTPVANDSSSWYVGNNHGLKFNTGVPTFDSTFSPINTANIATNSQADNSGNLIYYTNGVRIWNNSHSQISPATELIILGNMGGYTSDQMLSVQRPGSSTEYLLITNQLQNNLVVDTGLRVTTINAANVNNPIVSSYKVPVIVSSTYGFDTNPSDGAVMAGSSLTAVKKCNGSDYWVIATLRKGTTPYLVVFSLTSAGMAYSSEIQLPAGIGAFGSTIKMAPNGNKLIYTRPYTSSSFVYDFNKAQGIISSTYSTLTSTNYWGAAFSPDSKLLYVSDFNNKKVYQYNLNSGNINATKIEVASSTKQPFYMQNGPDGKIYVGMFYATDRLAVIHTPNALATLSNPNAPNFSINGPKPSFYAPNYVGPAMPNFVDAKTATAYFANNTPNAISAYVTGCQSYKFFPNVCGTSFKWKISNASLPDVILTDTNPNYTFPQNGTYNVTLMDASNNVLGTLPQPIVIATMPAPVISGSVKACTTVAAYSNTNNSVSLAAGETVVWTVTQGTGTIVGANNQANVQVAWSNLLPGKLRATVTNAAGCTSYSEVTISSLCPCDCLSTLGVTMTPQLDDSYRFKVENSNTNSICAGLPLRYTWTWTGGGPVVTTTNTITVESQSITVTIEYLNPNGTVLCSVVRVYQQAGTGNGRMSGNVQTTPIVDVAPNPSSGLFNIRVAEYIGRMSIKVFDANTKKEVFAQDDNNFYMEKAIDLTRLNPGIYILKLDGDGIDFTQKIIKK